MSLYVDKFELDNQEILIRDTETRELFNNSKVLISVKEFGAKGDGVTDDTVAIQSALDYAMTLGGGTVALPSGEYLISDTLIIRPHTAAPNIQSSPEINFIKMNRLKLLGFGEAIIRSSRVIETIIKTNDFTYPDNVGSYSNFYTEIENIKIDGNNSTNGIYVYNALHCIIKNCQIHNIGTGIIIDGYGEATIMDNVIKANACIYSTHDGDSLYIGNDLYSDGICIFFHGYGGASRIFGNTFTRINSNINSAIGVYMNSQENTDNVSYLIEGNSFDQLGYAVKCEGTETNKIAGVNIIANRLTGGGNTTTALFAFIHTINSIVSDNIIGIKDTYDTVNGLGLLSECDTIVINNNLINKVSGLALNLSNCINSVIQNNTFKNGLADYIVLSNGCAGTVIKDNIFKYVNNLAAYINDTVTSILFVNNIYVGYGNNNKVQNNSASSVVNTTDYVTTWN